MGKGLSDQDRGREKNREEIILFFRENLKEMIFYEKIDLFYFFVHMMTGQFANYKVQALTISNIRVSLGIGSEDISAFHEFFRI